MSVSDKVTKATFNGMMKRLQSGQAINSSNEAINKINKLGNNLLGGFEMAARAMESGSIKTAAKETFQAGGKTDYGKVAASYLGVTAGARVLSGGGVYKDANGNTNLVGVPFV